MNSSMEIMNFSTFTGPFNTLGEAELIASNKFVVNQGISPIYLIAPDLNLKCHFQMVLMSENHFNLQYAKLAHVP